MSDWVNIEQDEADLMAEGLAVRVAETVERRSGKMLTEAEYEEIEDQVVDDFAHSLRSLRVPA